VVLGGPVPSRLRLELAGTVDLLEEGAIGEQEADGVLVHARPELFPALRRFRQGGGRLPIFGLADGEADIPARLEWIREGADDLLDQRSAAEVLLRKLRSDISWRNPGEGKPGTPRIAIRIDRWLLASRRYLETRERLVAGLGEGGRARFLDCAFLRDQAARAADAEGAPDGFGQRRGGDRETLDWPIRLLAPVAGAGELLNIGADGACLSLPNAPGSGERLQVLLEGHEVAATVELEVRWQRRVARNRWQVGAFGIACNVSRGG
jgi:hypothetical protein